MKEKCIEQLGLVATELKNMGYDGFGGIGTVLSNLIDDCALMVDHNLQLKRMLVEAENKVAQLEAVNANL